MQNLIDLNEWFRHAITGPAQGAWIVWLRVVGELRVEGSGSSFLRRLLYGEFLLHRALAQPKPGAECEGADEGGPAASRGGLREGSPATRRNFSHKLHRFHTLSLHSHARGRGNGTQTPTPTGVTLSVAPWRSGSSTG